MANIAGVGTTHDTQYVVVENLSFNAGTYTKIRIFNSNTGQSRDVNSGSSTTSAVATFSGLSPNTTYLYYAETTYGGGDRRLPESGYVGYTTTSPPPPPEPNPLNWPTFYPSSSQYDLTASQWNAMTAKINEWRDYIGGYSNYPFTTAYTNNIGTASMFNEAVSALNAMNPPYIAPPYVNSSTVNLSDRLNWLKTSINSFS